MAYTDRYTPTEDENCTVLRFEQKASEISRVSPYHISLVIYYTLKTQPPHLYWCVRHYPGISSGIDTGVGAHLCERRECNRSPSVKGVANWVWLEGVLICVIFSPKISNALDNHFMPFKIFTDFNLIFFKGQHQQQQQTHTIKRSEWKKKTVYIDHTEQQNKIGKNALVPIYLQPIYLFVRKAKQTITRAHNLHLKRALKS